MGTGVVCGNRSVRLRGCALIDIATLALMHGLMMVALVRMLWRDDLDVEGEAPAARKPWHQPAEDGAE